MLLLFCGKRYAGVWGVWGGNINCLVMQDVGWIKIEPFGWLTQDWKSSMVFGLWVV